MYGTFTIRLALLGGAAVALIGCQSIRDAAGVTKSPPDEFAVVTKAPLVIPPDFNLRPPKPGAAPTNQSSPTDSAQDALFGATDPAALAASLPNTYSPAEKNMLANTGGANADHSVRTQIAADAKNMSMANDSFTDELLFRSKPDPNAGHPLNADAEKDKLVAEKSDGIPIEGGQAANKKDPQEGATIDKDGSRETKAPSDDDGWFSGGWFDIF
jgi:hypothetical protein